MKVGLQLYGVRAALTENLPATLDSVKAMGYDFVELAGGRYGLDGKSMNAELDKAGLTCVSVHSSPSLYLADREDVLTYLTELGALYSVIPCPPGRLADLTERWDETVALYTEMGQFFRDAGKRLLYHDHDFEFVEKDGKILLDTLLSTLAPVLDPEPDLCWISYAGVRPADFLSRYAGRVPVVHLKDYVLKNLPPKPVWQRLADGEEKPAKKSEAGFDYAPVGSGVESWPEIIEAARLAGTEYLIVEQDASPDPLRDAARSRAYLKETFGL